MSFNTDLQAALAALKFRILCRRGTQATLDLASMHAGEFAMATDTESVYACFGAGRFKQIAGGGIIIKGVYATLAALQAAHPTGADGDIYAAGPAPQHLYIWQVSAWTDMGVWNDLSLYATKAYVDQNINLVKDNLNRMSYGETIADVLSIDINDPLATLNTTRWRVYQTSSGIPSGFVAGFREVMYYNSTNIIIIVYQFNPDFAIFENYWNGVTWVGWRKISSTPM